MYQISNEISNKFFDIYYNFIHRYDNMLILSHKLSIIHMIYMILTKNLDVHNLISFLHLLGINKFLKSLT